MAEIIVSVTQSLYFYQGIEVYTETILPYYGSLVRWNNYIQTKMNKRPWEIATDMQRIGALRDATRIIDSLGFISVKTDPLQTLEFPRNKETVIPVTIEFACYEIALKLLDGFDPDQEVDNLSVTSQGMTGGPRDTYDRSFVLEHIRAGVPSAYAWTLLKPYLIDPRHIKISRVS